MRRTLAAFIAAVALLLPAGLSAQNVDFITVRFARYLEALRRQAGIPGMSATVLQNGVVVWEAGFGSQDVERNLPATPDTPYYLGDLTEVLSATMVLQCIEQGRLSFDTPVAVQLPDQPPTTATVRQLLIHAGTTPDGPLFEYSPARFAALAGAVEQCDKTTTFRQQMATTLLDRLAMSRSLPGLDAGVAVEPPLFEPARVEAYAALATEVAKPYQVDSRGRPTLSAFPPDTLNAAIGAVSTVRDLARFDAALTDLVLLNEETLVNAWTPRPAVDGRLRPFGHGWFAQLHDDEPFVWHFGYTPGVGSGLILKAPNRGTTLILLANSDGLTAQFALQDGDVTTSPFARLFLSLFR